MHKLNIYPTVSLEQSNSPVKRGEDTLIAQKLSESNLKAPLFVIASPPRHFSFQEVIRKIDSVRFLDQKIVFFNSKENLPREVFWAREMEEIELQLRKQVRPAGQIRYQLKMVIRTAEGGPHSVFISDIVVPYGERLSEIMEKIQEIGDTHYRVPVTVNFPDFY